MEKEIIEILINHQVDETSSTGKTGEKIIYSGSYSDIAKDIAIFFQAITDPENQPNQYGIVLSPPALGVKEVSDEELEQIIPVEKWNGTVSNRDRNRERWMLKLQGAEILRDWYRSQSKLSEAGKKEGCFNFRDEIVSLQNEIRNTLPNDEFREGHLRALTKIKARWDSLVKLSSPKSEGKELSEITGNGFKIIPMRNDIACPEKGKALLMLNSTDYEVLINKYKNEK